MGNRWKIDAYTFVTEGSHYPYSVGFETANLDGDFLSANLTITADDTSKLVFTIPYMKGKDLYPGQTLIDVKYGDGNSWERKFLGTVIKKVYESTTGVYSFEATGALGTYRFMPNYDKYEGGTIESILATEMSRFKGTAAAPYADDNPWTLLYSGHDEIPSTFGDIETEGIGLEPAFNYKIQNSSANAYEFIKLITRAKNYYFPSDVYPKSSLHLFEKGEKIYFKRVRQYNTQQVRYDDNLISYAYDRRTTTMKARAYNTVEGAYPSYGGYTSEKYPVPFNYRRLTLSPKSDKSAYTIEEIANECERLAASGGSVEAYAFDKHLVDDSVPWFEMDKYVYLVLYENGAERTTAMQVAQIYYDLVDSTKSRVKLGSISSWLTVKNEANEKDVDAELKNRLETSGGTMTGAIKYDNVEDDVETKNTIQDGNILLEYENNDSSPTLPYSKSASVEIMSNHENSQQPRIEMSNEYKLASGDTRSESNYRNALGEVGSYVQKDSDNNYVSRGMHNLAGSGLQLEMENYSTNQTFRNNLSAGGMSLRKNGVDVANFNTNEIELRGRIFGTCNLIDMASLEQGTLVDGTGAEYPATTRLRSGYTSVDASTTYTISMTSGVTFIYVFFYNSSKAFISKTAFLDTAQSTFTTPSGCAYIRVNIHYTNDATILPSAVSNLQLEKGSSASSYVPFAMDNVELTECVKGKKIYFTPINCTANTEGCYFINKGVSVYVHLGISNISASNNIANILWHSIPQNLRPKHYCGFGGWQYASDWSSTNACAVTVNPDGDIHVFASLPNVFADFEYTLL